MTCALDSGIVLCHIAVVVHWLRKKNGVGLEIDAKNTGNEEKLTPWKHTVLRYLNGDKKCSVGKEKNSG